jgi:RNA polymerase-binding transcription factor DksA
MKPRHHRKVRATRRKPGASTTDVLGSSSTPDRIKPKWRKHYQRLLELRDVLSRRQIRLNKDALDEQPAFSSHMADAGTDNYDRDFALSVLSAEQDAVYEIDEALDRIRNGGYGKCELTDKPIEPERLEAIPWTRFTADAEKELEHNHAVNHTKLGDRESVPRRSAATEAREAEEEDENEE